MYTCGGFVLMFGPIPKKGSAKECSNYRTIAVISHASKVMLKLLQDRVQQYMKHELPNVQAGLILFFIFLFYFIIFFHVHVLYKFYFIFLLQNFFFFFFF